VTIRDSFDLGDCEVNSVPILLYHGITNSTCEQMMPFAVTPPTLKRHLDAVQERGYRCLTVSDFIDQRGRQEIGHNDKVALITFDDGYADFVENALPAMLERNIPSTIYITTGWIDGGMSSPTPRPDDRMMTWRQVAELPQANVEVGSHSHSHPQMDTLDVTHALDELTRSKALLEHAIGRSVRTFAYPHGYSHARLRRQVAAAGYDSGAAVRSAFSHVNDNAFRLARLMLFSDTSSETVERWLDGAGVPLAPRFEHPKTRARRISRRTKALVQGKPGTDYA
jgi:peptidoglycan/xylan/chitin deacetylase (PgdA/CDA1 family)